MIPLTFVPQYAQVSQLIDGTGPFGYARAQNTPLKTIAVPVPGSSTVTFLR